MSQITFNNQQLNDEKIMSIIKKIINVPSKNSKWYDHNSVSFIVTDVRETNNQTVVHYKRQDGQEYSCLMYAFTSRFYENINQ